MLVGATKLTDDGERVFVSADVDGRDLWFSVPAVYGDYVTEAADPFVVALLLPAMKNAEPLEIRGKVSGKLLSNLPALMALLAELIEGIRPVEVRAHATYEGQPSPGVASGFSGGIDSFCVIADHLAGRFHLTHLLYNKVGSHPTDQIFRGHFDRLVPGANELGLPLVAIESNIDDFVPFAFQQSHTLRNVAAVLVLQSLFGKYLYASTYHYRDLFVGRTYDMAYMDPLILPLISTERMECSSVGSEYSRVAKTLRVAEVPVSYDRLDVCVHPQKADGRLNCSVCWKCCRTELTLEIAGKLNLYANVFDLDAWQREKPSYLRVVRSSRSTPLLRELDDFAAERGYPMPSMPFSQVASIPRRLTETALVIEQKAMQLAPRRLKDAVKRLI